MMTTMTVTRVHDRGYGSPISTSEKIWFTPGEQAPVVMSETYGTYTVIACAEDVLAVGGSTTCTVSFSAPAAEVLDSSWTINGLRVGAWPSQTT